MLPGPIIIRKCSSCGKLIKEYTTASGNTYGAKFWTDGKMEAPMLPDEPWLMKCEHCGALIWIDEQEQVGAIDPFRRRDWDDDRLEDTRARDDTILEDAHECDSPSTQDFITTIAKGVSDNRKERFLRLQVWWAGNNSRRQGTAATPLSEDETANLRVFATLLDESDENDRLMKAEAMRELGKHEEALALLSQPFSEELVQAAATIKALASQHDPFVKKIQHGYWVEMRPE